MDLESLKQEEGGWVLVAIQAALQAGALLRQGFHTPLEVKTKSNRHDFVTQYDVASEEIIFSTLMERYPLHGFIGEERGVRQSGEVVWIVDPLDGTVNFVRGIPCFAVSIAAAVKDELVVACIYQPITQELFWAQKKRGAFLNGTPLKVSSNAHLNEAFVATGFPYNLAQNPFECIERFVHITRQGIPSRRLGASAIDLAYVAAGRFDAHWEVLSQPWDYAAGKLLIEEAGGMVTSCDGKGIDIFKANSILASNGLLHSIMKDTLRI